MIRFFVAVPLIVLLVTPKGFAQHWQGTSLGNYSGTHALYHNPAFVADSRYSVYGNLAGINYFVGSNHVKWDAPFSYLALISNTVSDEYRNDKGKVLFPRRYLAQKLNGNLKYINTGVDLRLPSLMISLKGGKYGIAANTRTRGLMNVSQTTEPLARLIRGSTQDTTLYGQKFVDQKGKMLLNGFVEYSLTLGGVLIDDETEFIKVGITAKRLIGVTQNRIHIRSADYELIPDPEWNNLRYMPSVSSIDGETNYTLEEGIESISLNPNWWLLGKTAPGNGWGLDIGAVYEYRPEIRSYKNFGNTTESPKRDPTVNKYLYRVAVSLTDVGFLNFNNTFYNYAQTADNLRGNLNYNSFNPWSGINNFYGALERTLSMPAAIPKARKILLPMAFQASIDYNLRPNVYVNALWVTPLTRAGSDHMRQEAVLSVIPRYERRWYEISVPISVMNQYRSFGIGLAGRAGPLWVGTDHLGGLLNVGKPKTLSLYAGLSMGIFQKPLTDEIPCWPPRKGFFKRMLKTE